MSTNSSSSSTSTMGLSGAIVAVLAASAASYYYHSSSSSTADSKKLSDTTTTTTSRDISTNTTDTDPNQVNRLERWEDRWSSGKTNWHKTEVHASLLKYCDTDLLDAIIGGGGRILVPLCGKTIDMVYLARKRSIAQVVGIDGIPKAIEEFMNEQSAEFTEFTKHVIDAEPTTITNTVESTTTSTANSGFVKYTAESIALITGDFFDVTLDVINGAGTTATPPTTTPPTQVVPVLGLFDGVWDRGSLVAIDPSLRDQYVNKIGELIAKPNGKYLLSTFVRPNDTTTGPPFSIDETEVRRLFGQQAWVDTITRLESHSFLSTETSWYKAMTSYFRYGNCQEEIYIITTK